MLLRIPADVGRTVNTGQLVEWFMSNGNVAAVLPMLAEPAAVHIQGVGDFNGQ